MPFPVKKELRALVKPFPNFHGLTVNVEYLIFIYVYPFRPEADSKSAVLKLPIYPQNDVFGRRPPSENVLCQGPPEDKICVKIK